MKNDTIGRLTVSIIVFVGLLFFIFSQWNTINGSSGSKWNSAIENNTACVQDLTAVDDKQRGAHVFGIEDSTDFQPLIQNNLEWVTLVSWGYQDDYDSPNVKHHAGDSLQILRHNSYWQNKIELVHAAGFKVFFKPHLWMHYASDGKWRSDIFPTNNENWELWKETYRNFILRYARVAELGNAEMFCIGTELSRLTIEKPLFWKDLIQEIRSIYSGKITYASSWHKEFEEITFWDQLDYIGIQAYFPLVENEYPSVEQISHGWKKYFPAIEAIHKKYNRKVLFTEMGYKSTANSAIKPWEWIEDSSNLDKHVSAETQANCYEAFFKTVWKKEWFAGVHIWQMRSDYSEEKKINNLDFTPQGKPAEIIIAKGFE
jgi:Glycoside Hydrolase Family 113